MTWKPPNRTWRRRFADAFRGIGEGVRGQATFSVHLPAAAIVLLLAALLTVDTWGWALLILSIVLVISIELVNSSLEKLARTVEPRENDGVRAALDIASGAVLTASIGAAAVGLLVLGSRILELYV